MLDHLWLKEYFNQPGTDYLVTLGENLDKDFVGMAKELDVHPKELLRRSLILMKHAVAADSVEMVKNRKKYRVVLK